nr:hypothetical protein [Ureaplasma parvum]
MNLRHSKTTWFRKPFQTNTRFKSPLLYKFLITSFFVVIPMIVFFILYGEINLLGFNGIIGANGRWYGEGFKLDENQQWIVGVKDFYHWNPIVYDQLKPKPDAFMVEKMQALINKITNQYNHGVEFGTNIISSYPVWVAMFSTLGLAVIVCIIFAFSTPKIRWDILTPVVSCWFGMFILIISGFIPSQIWGYLIRFLILVIAFILPIFIMTKITNAIMNRSKHFETYAADLYNELKDSEQYYNEFNKKRLELKKRNKANERIKYKIEDDQKGK